MRSTAGCMRKNMENDRNRALSLSQIKSVELEILRYFKDFCERENIKYFLSNGTLLGAVNYGGFIPWDDDIDVFVPREDYNRLISIFEDTERYCLFSFERNKKYRFPFAKLCDMTTEKVEENIENGVKLGLDIDIFPLDMWEDNYDSACKQVHRINNKIKLLAFLKCGKALSVNPLKRFIKNIVLYLMRGAAVPLIRNWHAVRIEANVPKWLGCVVWCIYGLREIIPADVFSSTVSVLFEGDEYPAPSGYDVYLRSLYGDYTKDPPKERQTTHHRFSAYWL